MRLLGFAVALLSTLPMSAAAQAVEDEARSHVAIDFPEGIAEVTTVNVAYRPVWLFDAASDSMTTLLLKQTIARIVRPDMEGPLESTLTVEAERIGADGSRSPAFSFSQIGDEGREVWLGYGGAYYAVTLYGCCGAFDRTDYYSLRNGTRLFASNMPPVALDIPNSGGLERLVAVETVWGMDIDPVMANRTDSIALISYASPSGLMQRVLVTAKDGGSSDLMAMPNVGWTGPDTEGMVANYTIWAADGSTDPQDFDGVFLIVELGLGRISIPIMGDRLGLSEAITEGGLILSEAPLE